MRDQSTAYGGSVLSQIKAIYVTWHLNHHFPHIMANSICNFIRLEKGLRGLLEIILGHRWDLCGPWKSSLFPIEIINQLWSIAYCNTHVVYYHSVGLANRTRLQQVYNVWILITTRVMLLQVERIHENQPKTSCLFFQKKTINAIIDGFSEMTMRIFFSISLDSIYNYY